MSSSAPTLPKSRCSAFQTARMTCLPMSHAVRHHRHRKFRCRAALETSLSERSKALATLAMCASRRLIRAAGAAERRHAHLRSPRRITEGAAAHLWRPRDRRQCRFHLTKRSQHKGLVQPGVYGLRLPQFFLLHPGQQQTHSRQPDARLRDRH
jgi:hypothetical protein